MFPAMVLEPEFIWIGQHHSERCSISASANGRKSGCASWLLRFPHRTAESPPRRSPSANLEVAEQDGATWPSSLSTSTISNGQRFPPAIPPGLSALRSCRVAGDGGGNRLSGAGGDEFIYPLAGCLPPKRQVESDDQEGVRRTFPPGEHDLTVAFFRDQRRRRLQNLLKNRIRRCLSGQEAGRNGFQFPFLGHERRHALRTPDASIPVMPYHGELTLHNYQPLVALENGTYLVGVEGPIRWRHPRSV